MRIRASWYFTLIVLAGPAVAAEPQGKIVLETWDAAYVNGGRAGYVQIGVQEVERDGEKRYRSTMVLDLTLKRFGDISHARQEQGTEENRNGEVTMVFMRQKLGKGQDLELTGTVEGKRLHVRVTGRQQIDKKIPWNNEVVGLYRQQRLFKEKKVKPGDFFSFLQYEPAFNTVVTVQVNVAKFEAVIVRGSKKKLLRVETASDEIEGVQPPALTYWLDKELAPVRYEMEMEGLGRLEFIRGTKQLATAPLSPARLPDIGLTQMIRLNRSISRPHDVNSVVYRITLPKLNKPAMAFVQDARQHVKNINGHTFELHVKAVRKPEPTAKGSKEAPEEFLKSNYFINSADSEVQKLAQRAVGSETDPWKKARQIERWVHDNMRSLNFTEAMATADHVARTLEGDCTEYAMLTAAMCRAVHVPSRTALGLVYADLRQGPALAYHMWTEVWIDGQWIAMDATLGRGSIGAAHIKITDHSWHDMQSMKPLLPVTRVIQGKPSIQVIRVDEEE